MMPKPAKMAPFLFFGWVTAGIGIKCNFFDWDCSSDAELHTYMDILKKMWSVEYFGPLYRYSESDPLKWDLGGLAPKKSSPKSLRYFGCRIQCRLWFCCKIWSSLMTLPFVDVWSWGAKMAKQSWLYLNLFWKRADHKICALQKYYGWLGE